MGRKVMNMQTAVNQNYVLVTPVRNEDQTIEITIKSVLAQTVLPCEWIIVSDESTDQTDSIVSRYAEQFPWLRLIQLKDRPARNFASVVFATELGVKSLQTRDYAFLGLLDADVRLPLDYYAKIMSRFLDDPYLGLAGGWVMDIVDGKRTRNRQSLQDVAGAVQFFRRNCFESLGGLIALPEGGWDTVTCVRARMNDFKTASFPDLIVEHLKPRNSAEGNWVRRNWQFGIRDFALANHPVFEVAKCCGRCMEFPPLIGALARLFGYGWAAISNQKRCLPADLYAHIRREQLARLNPFCRQPQA